MLSESAESAAYILKEIGRTTQKLKFQKKPPTLSQMYPLARNSNLVIGLVLVESCRSVCKPGYFDLLAAVTCGMQRGKV